MKKLRELFQKTIDLIGLINILSIRLGVHENSVKYMKDLEETCEKDNGWSLSQNANFLSRKPTKFLNQFYYGLKLHYNKLLKMHLEKFNTPFELETYNDKANKADPMNKKYPLRDRISFLIKTMLNAFEKDEQREILKELERIENETNMEGATFSTVDDLSYLYEYVRDRYNKTIKTPPKIIEREENNSTYSSRTM